MALLDKLKNKKVILGISALIVVLGIGGLYIKKVYIPKKDISIDTNNYIETYTIADNEKIFINGIILPVKSKDFLITNQDEISKLNVTNGKIVKEGDFLYTIKNQSILDEIEELKAQLDTLKKTDSESEPTLKTEILKLEAQISTLDKKAYTNITAPFSGKIYLDEEQTTTDEKSMIVTLQSNEFYMKGQINEQDLTKLQIDDPANVLILPTNKNITGRISYISDRPSSEEVGSGGQMQLSYYDIKISFDEQDNLINGFHTQASIEIQDSICKIPSSAVLTDEKEKTYVFKSLNGILKKQIIQIQSQNDEYTMVNEGLDKKDIIIRYPSPEMKEGDNISPDDLSTTESSYEKDGK